MFNTVQEHNSYHKNVKYVETNTCNILYIYKFKVNELKVSNFLYGHSEFT